MIVTELLFHQLVHLSSQAPSRHPRSTERMNSMSEQVCQHPVYHLNSVVVCLACFSRVIPGQAASPSEKLWDCGSRFLDPEAGSQKATLVVVVVVVISSVKILKAFLIHSRAQ